MAYGICFCLDMLTQIMILASSAPRSTTFPSHLHACKEKSTGIEPFLRYDNLAWEQMLLAP